MIYSFDSTVSLLHPYPFTSYQFKLQAENVAGNANSTETDVITTAESGILLLFNHDYRFIILFSLISFSS